MLKMLGIVLGYTGVGCKTISEDFCGILSQ